MYTFMNSLSVVPLKPRLPKGGGVGGLTASCRHFEIYVHDMFLKITELVRHTLSPFFISKTLGEIPIFGTSPILAYRPISLKIDIFRLTMFYYVIVTSYEDRFSWFHKIVRVCHVDFTCRITVIFGTLKDGSLLVYTSGVARAFQNEEEN